MRSVIQAGDRIGPFTIVAKLGRGGMSTVYNAYEAGLDREVALKVLPIDLLDEPGFADRFEREARLIAKLEHPHIVPLYAYGIDDGVPWMALRLVRGGHLGERLERHAIGRESGLAYFTMIADALDHAHSLGVVHRDLKPQNVLLGEHGELYLADFGISRLLQGRTTITNTGAVLGTPQYMSPEQAQDAQVGPATDIYALGVMAYQWLTGLLPFDADTPFAVMFKHVNAPLELEPLSGFPERVQQVVACALAKQPDQRWPSAGRFIEELAAGMGAHDLPDQVLANGRLTPSMIAAISSRRLNRVAAAPTEVLRDTPTPRPTPATPRGGSPGAPPAPPPGPPVDHAAHTVVRSAADMRAADAGHAAGAATGGGGGGGAGGGSGRGGGDGGGDPPGASGTGARPATPPRGSAVVAPAELQFRPRTAPARKAPDAKLLAAGGGALVLLVAAAWWLFSGDDDAAADAAPATAAPLAESAPAPAPADVPPADEAPPPPLPVGEGRLLLESDLDCELSINGRKRGDLVANTPMRLEVVPARYPVSCVSPAHPDVVSSQVAVVDKHEPTVVLFELKYEIEQRERRRQEEERRRLEQEKAEAQARQRQEDQQAAEARRLVDEARRREDERRAEETRKLEEARQAAERRRREEQLKLEEARRAAEARRTGTAPPPAPRSSDAGVAARPDEDLRREAEARRLAEERKRAEERRLAEEKAAAEAAAQAALAAQQQQQQQAQAAAPPPPPRRLVPVPVSTPQPDYPVDALRSGTKGEVQVQIRVGLDGRVLDVRVLQARPRGTFERAVTSAVRTWRFEPLDEEATITRTIVFK